MTEGHRVGYVRVSSIDQNTDRQLEGIKLDKIFLDKASGRDSHREELEAMIDYVRSGDTEFVQWANSGQPGSVSSPLAKVKHSTIRNPSK